MNQPVVKRRHQVAPTKTQSLMIVLMGFAYFTMSIWLVPEIRGILSVAKEDTFSEWVWDLPQWAVLSIAAFHLLAGVLFVWSSIHFIEGYLIRR